MESLEVCEVEVEVLKSWSVIFFVAKTSDKKVLK